MLQKCRAMPSFVYRLMETRAAIDCSYQPAAGGHSGYPTASGMRNSGSRGSGRLPGFDVNGADEYRQSRRPLAATSGAVAVRDDAGRRGT